MTTYHSARSLGQVSGVPRDTIVRQLAAQLIVPNALLARGNKLVPLFDDRAVALVRANHEANKPTPKL